MSLSNSHLTTIIQNTQQRLAVSLRNEGEYLKRNGREREFDQSQQINYLLTNAQTQGPISTLEELNWNWRFVKYKDPNAPDLVSPLPSAPQDKEMLFAIIKIQLEAMARGQKATETNYSRPMINSASGVSFLSSSWPERRIEQRVYYYGGYSRTDLLTDILIWDWVTRPHYGGYGGGCCDSSMPPAPYSTGTSGGSSSSSDEKAKAYLAIALFFVITFEIILAVVSIMYMIGALKENFDQLIHLENLAENLLKLTGTGAGLWGGMVAGVAIGAALSLSGGGLVFLGILTAIIGGGLALFAANQIFTGFHLLTNRSSAIDSDPRFQLSYFQRNHLEQAGYDIISVQEAIREVGFLMKQNNSWHLTFWRPENEKRQELISLLRDLKSGHKSQYLHINGKAFDLWKKTPEQFSQTTPIYARTAPDYAALQRAEVITQHPPKYVPPTPSAPPPDYDSEYNQNYHAQQ